MIDQIVKCQSDRKTNVVNNDDFNIAAGDNWNAGRKESMYSAGLEQRRPLDVFVDNEHEGHGTVHCRVRYIRRSYTAFAMRATREENAAN